MTDSDVPHSDPSREHPTPLEERAARGSRKAFLQVLDRVPSAEPVEGDELPEELREDGSYASHSAIHPRTEP